MATYSSILAWLSSLLTQTVKRLPTMQETQVQSLCREDLLEKKMATHSSILAWKIPWMEEHGRLQSMGLQSQTRLSEFTFKLHGQRSLAGYDPWIAKVRNV